MLNFTVGPVMSDEEVLKEAAQSTPYFRTPEFISANYITEP
jgi:aspartate aminotransferase-like enzyme